MKGATFSVTWKAIIEKKNYNRKYISNLRKNKNKYKMVEMKFS